MRRLAPLGAALVTLLGLAATAHARSVEYMSQHPLPRKIGHGFCYIDVPHFHDFPPSDPRLYRQVDGQYYFVGDPAPFDYDGPRYSYYGAHPIADADVHFGTPSYCYLRGPHYHWYAPPPQMQFELKGGAYWYVGNYEPVYYSERPRYVVINDVYAPVVYTRPVVDVRVAPPAFHGEIVMGGPGVAAHAVVGAPVISAGVYVAPPPPPVLQVGVGVGVGVGGAAVVGGPPPGAYHHDNGRHNGWYKHGRGGPPPAGGWRGAPPAQPSGWRGAPAAQPSGWRGGGGPAPAAHGNGWRGGPAAAAAPAPAPGQGGAWRGGNQGGGHAQQAAPAQRSQASLPKRSPWGR